MIEITHCPNCKSVVTVYDTFKTGRCRVCVDLNASDAAAERAELDERGIKWQDERGKGV